MKPIYILFMAMAMHLLPVAGFAQDRYDCITKCAEEKNARDAACPSSFDSNATSSSSRLNGRCMQKSEAAYSRCFNRCPPPQFSTSTAPAPRKGN